MGWGDRRTGEDVQNGDLLPSSGACLCIGPGVVPQRKNGSEMCMMTNSV